MVTIKKPQEVKTIAAGGKILADILEQLFDQVKPGVKTLDLDKLAEKLIIQAGGKPSFKNFKGRAEEKPFPTTICASVNNQLVHTPASDYELKEGDIFTIDIGMRYPAEGGFYTDMARTRAIGPVSPLARKLIKVTKQALEIGIAQVKHGNHVSDISKAVQKYVEASGFSVVRQLVGHGVGYEVHEEPRIPNFFDSKHTDVELKNGMVLAIEPMVNVGEYAIKTLNDGWTIVAADGGLSAHFENTVAVTEAGSKILTIT